MTCRCSAVGKELVFLFCFILLYTEASVVSSNIPPPVLQSRLPHCRLQPCYITGNVCCFLSETYELFLTFNLSLHILLLFWRNLITEKIARFLFSSWCVTYFLLCRWRRLACFLIWPLKFRPLFKF